MKYRKIIDRAFEFDGQFTFPVFKLEPDQAKRRVSAAWLAGYQACLDSSRKRRTKDRRCEHG
jgi:hypothetical protein